MANRRSEANPAVVSMGRLLQARTTHRLTIAAVLLLAAALRLYRLGYHELNLDEIGQIQVAEHSLSVTVQLSAWHVASTPLDYLVTHVALLIGRDPGILRLPVALWGTLVVGAIYTFGRKVASHWTGIIAGLATAVLPLLVNWSRIVRFYSLPVLLFVITTILLWYALEKGGWLRWLLYGFTLLCAVYSHYYAIILAGGQAAWLVCLCIVHRRRWDQFWSLLGLAVLVLLAFAPWVYYDNLVIGIGNPSPNTVDQFRLVWPWTYEARQHTIREFPTLVAHPFKPGGDAAWVVGSLTLAGLAASMIAYLTKQNTLGDALVLCWAIPVVAAPIIVILHYYAQYDFGARQMVFFVPFWVLAWSALPLVVWRAVCQGGQRAIGQVIAVSLAVASCLAVVIASLPGLGSIYLQTYGSGWNEATRYILREVTASDLLLVEDPRAIWFYAPELEPDIVAYYDKGHWSTEQARTYAQDQLARHRAAYVIPWLTDTMDVAFKEMATQAGGTVDERCFGDVCIHRCSLSTDASVRIE
jgi:hypothetical protein